jgi:hypothetical protein
VIYNFLDGGVRNQDFSKGVLDIFVLIFFVLFVEKIMFRRVINPLMKKASLKKNPEIFGPLIILVFSRPHFFFDSIIIHSKLYQLVENVFFETWVSMLRFVQGSHFIFSEK